jgi:GT2 family glycosyltransferase
MDRFTVVVPTRNRPDQLWRTLAALQAQEPRDFDIVVVDQSEEAFPIPSGERTLRLRDRGRGLSRARNLGWRFAQSEWIVFIDDDVRVGRGWSAALHGTLERHSDASSVGVYVEPVGVPPGEYFVMAVFRVGEEQVFSGPHVPPSNLGIGACMAYRRSALEEQGGFDERLGAGTAPFPAAEETDLHYRLLRAGHRGAVTPSVRVFHEQWRRKEQLGALYGGYMAGWGGLCGKVIRNGEVWRGLGLLRAGVISAVRSGEPSPGTGAGFRLRLAASRLRGLLTGTYLAISRDW